MEHMDFLQRQSRKVDRQLAGLYREVEFLSGIDVRSSVAPAASGVPPTKQMEQLRHQESRLRQQIENLAQQLPIRNNCVQHVGKAAARLREFLATTGGERGGWDEEHHTLYLHLRSKLDRYHLVDALAQALPAKSRDQIQMHEEWYRKLVDLKRQQRHELEQWKQSRKLDREERWRQLARDGEANLVRDEQQTKQLQQWVSTWKKQRHNVYRQLEMWKEEKIRKQLEAEADAAKNRHNKSAPHDPKRVDQEYQKLLAYLWRLECNATKEATQSTAQFVADLETNERAASANRHVRKRHERNLQWIAQRRQVLTKMQESRGRRLPPANKKTSAGRDPQRILRPTSASTARHLAESVQVESQHGRPSYILDMPVRSIPTWRQLATGNF